MRLLRAEPGVDFVLGRIEGLARGRAVRIVAEEGRGRVERGFAGGAAGDLVSLGGKARVVGVVACGWMVAVGR